MQHGFEEPQGSLQLSTFSQALTKALHTNQIAVGGPVWQEALVQHCLEEL